MLRFARLTPVESGALLLITVATLYVGTTNGHYSYDDAYITYRMADNFSRGLGFVYNPGEWHLGSTAAFYGLLIGSLRWVLSAISPSGAPPIPAIGGLISALSLLATGWLLYGLGRNARAPLCGLAAGLFYITNPMIFVTFGGEMPFQIALITGAFFAYQQQARPIAAALASLAILTRPDGLQAAGVLLVYDIASRWKTTKSVKALVPWRELLTAARPDLSPREISDRWRLAFDLLLQLYGQPVADAFVAPPTPAVVAAFVTAGLDAPRPGPSAGSERGDS